MTVTGRDVVMAHRVLRRAKGHMTWWCVVIAMTSMMLIILDEVFKRCGHERFFAKGGAIKLFGICELPAGEWFLWALFVGSLVVLLVCWVNDIRFVRTWQGQMAVDRIRAPKDDAQEIVRENIERGDSIELYVESKVLDVLQSGNFIDILSQNAAGKTVHCKLKSWVIDCFKQHPDLVDELHEKKEWERNFV